MSKETTMDVFEVNLGADGTPSVSGHIPFDIEQRRVWRGKENPSKAFYTNHAVKDADGKPTAVCVGNANPTTLLQEDWEFIDSEVRQVRQKNMRFVNWLLDKDCVINLPNGFATTQYTWQDISEMSGADLSMDGLKQTDVDRVEYTPGSIPLPIISKNWRLNLRYLAESRNKGIPMDTFAVSECAREVTKFAENMVVVGTANFKYAGNIIYGLLDSPNVAALTTGTNFTKAWDDVTITGNDILQDFLAMVGEMNSNKHYGPKFTLWLPQKYQTALALDYDSAKPGLTIAERLMNTGMLDSIEYSAFFTQDSSSKDRVVLIDANKNNIAVISGMPFRDFEWQSLGGWVIDHKIAGIYVPLIRADSGGTKGIVKATLG